MNSLILASASPRRKEILSLLKIPFSIIPADIEENVFSIDDIARVAQDKANFILQKYPHNIIIGADTVVVVQGEILGKPKDLADAKEMIQKLSGKVHSVYTGVSILSSANKINGLIETRVFVNPIREKEIDFYFEEEHILDAAGAYKIQGAFSKFIERIEGDYWNIVGLPLSWVYENLKKITKI